jgi:DNA-directed RNA polymerase subunit M/transcription elongation factor TFIIS
MRFCKNCGRVMRRDPSSGSVVFRCHCGEEIEGGAGDARVGGAVLGSAETLDMYRLLIRGAPFDRTNQLVRRSCPDCGLDYMVQIRVGDAEVIVYKCKCGYEAGGGAVAGKAAGEAAAGKAAGEAAGEAAAGKAAGEAAAGKAAGEEAPAK